MSGNAHQNRVLKRAIEAALKKLRDSPSSQITSGKESGKSRAEAFFLFFVAEVYVVMSAFGVSVNFIFGTAMCLFMLIVALHLLWRSIYTQNWTLLSRIAGSAILFFGCGVVINPGIRKYAPAEEP